VRRLLNRFPEGAPLEQLLPPPQMGHRSLLQRRAALASTLVAGLELSRDGAVVLEQNRLDALRM
jgi:segregation and condensation protein A